MPSFYKKRERAKNAHSIPLGHSIRIIKGQNIAKLGDVSVLSQHCVLCEDGVVRRSLTVFQPPSAGEYPPRPISEAKGWMGGNHTIMFLDMLLQTHYTHTLHSLLFITH